MSSATARQLEFVQALKARCHLSEDWFAGYCQATFGGPAEQMDPQTCSALIAEMMDWADNPAALLRAQGQQDMFAGVL